MDRMEEDGAYDLCGRIIGLAMQVHSTLGCGFLESVYRNALALELRRGGYSVETERPIEVRYGGEVVGAFVADLLVQESVIVELKATQVLGKIHEVQLVNYLTAIGLNEGLLLNFGAPRLEYKKKFRICPAEPVTL
jgi:GxxExxY protein